MLPTLPMIVILLLFAEDLRICLHVLLEDCKFKVPALLLGGRKSSFFHGKFFVELRG